jgi:hypothetical protein
LEKRAEFVKMMKSYFEAAKGPFKYKAMAENGPLLIFDFFEKFIE